MSDNGNASPAAEGGGGLAHRDRSKDIRHKWSSFNSQAARRTIDQQLTFEQFSVVVKMPCNNTAAWGATWECPQRLRPVLCDLQLYEGLPAH